jgi:parallel beta-helix repeat protein
MRTMLIPTRASLTAVSLLVALFAMVVAPGRASAQSAATLVRMYVGAAAPSPNLSVNVAPATANATPGTSIQFTASITGTTNTAVVWTATGGTITSSGQYTAATTAGTFSVTATISGGTAAGRATVTIASTSDGAGVAPGQDIQAQINALPTGGTLRLLAGTHRLPGPLVPKSGITLTGDPGAIVSGARVLSGFTRSGSYWTVGGQTQENGPIMGSCLAAYPRCNRPEELYIDDVPLRHVASLGDVGPGRWYFDYGADRIYFYDDPTGRRVEAAVVSHAFGGSASNVTIEGLVIEKFANRAQQGAVDGVQSSGWTVRNNEIRLNHGLGLRLGTTMNAIDNYVHHNGQLGVGGVGDNILVEGNEISYNNTAGYDPDWEAGGTKFVQTLYLLVRNNFVHHNYGPGLWTDIDNRSSVFEGNLVEDNLRMGILHEISYAIVIRNNTVRRNGFGLASWVWGAGIVISSSSNAEVYGNVVEDNAGGIVGVQQNRGSGPYGAYQVSNLWVHDNTVRLTQGYMGIGQDVGDTSYFTSRNNRFERNTYSVGSYSYPFAWMDAARDYSQWRSFGNDVTGTLTQ